MEVSEVQETKPGGRWVQISLTQGSDLAAAIQLLGIAAVAAAAIWLWLCGSDAKR